MAYLRQFPNVVMNIAFCPLEAVESMGSGGVRPVYEVLTKGESPNRIV